MINHDETPEMPSDPSKWQAYPYGITSTEVKFGQHVVFSGTIRAVDLPRYSLNSCLFDQSTWLDIDVKRTYKGMPLAKRRVRVTLRGDIRPYQPGDAIFVVTSYQGEILDLGEERSGHCRIWPPNGVEFSPLPILPDGGDDLYAFARQREIDCDPEMALAAYDKLLPSEKAKASIARVKSWMQAGICPTRIP